MGIGASVSAAKSSNDLMKKQIAEQQAELKQKRQSLFNDELETLKSGANTHIESNPDKDTGQGGF